MSFKDKVVIVTGAGGGIGESYAKRCAQEGMKVCVAEINAEQGMRVVNEIKAAGGEAVFAQVDVSSEESCKTCADTVKAEWGVINYLINNAAIFGDMKVDSLMAVDASYLNKFMAVNAFGCLYMARACVPHMPDGSAIVNQSSIAAWLQNGYYSIAKLTMSGITTSLAQELARRKIRVNAIAPGPIDTPALRKTAGGYADELAKQIPIRRLGTADDLVGGVLFLLSEQASWVTGLIMNIDGGKYMRV